VVGGGVVPGGARELVNVVGDGGGVDVVGKGGM
jgi:hypothetical protein